MSDDDDVSDNDDDDDDRNDSCYYGDIERYIYIYISFGDSVPRT